MANLLPFAGGAIALAGADKLVGDRGYNGMFRHLGWSRNQMEAAAIAEVAGGLLMVPRSTRRIGGAIVAAVSAAIIISELSEGDMKLAAPRGLVLLSALAAVLTPGD